MAEGDSGRETEAQHHRDAIMQRVRVGVTGLAAVFLLTLLAASVFALLGHQDPHATQLANGVVVSNAAAPEEPPKEPLAELGIAPGGNPARAPESPAANNAMAPAPVPAPVGNIAVRH